MRMKIAIPLFCLLFIVSLTQVLVPVGSWTSDDHVFDDFGPRVDNLVLNITSDVSSLMQSLQDGQIDVAASVVPKWWLWLWSFPPYNDPNDPNYIKKMPVNSTGMYQFDLNHKETINTYPNWKNPMTYQKFRQAIAHLTNKTDYVKTILDKQAVKLDTPIMPWTVWYNSLCSDYYPYNVDLARAALDVGGFIERIGAGTVPGAPPGADEWRVYPPGHEKEGELLDPLILYILANDPFRMEAGKRIAANLKMVGVPTQDYILPMSGCYTPVFVDQDFHLYTGKWSLSNDPDYMYDLWGGHAIDWPNYDWYNSTAYNEAAARIKYAVTFNDALNGAMDAQMIFTQDVGFIPLWTDVGYTAHRGYANSDTAKPWEGFVNAEGVGLYGWRTYLSAHTGDAPTGGTIKEGVKNRITQLNPLRSTTDEEWEALGKVYDTLLKYDPYTFEDRSWMAHGYYSGSYYNSALKKECTMLTFHLEDNVYWHDDIQFTSADVEFSIEYQRDNHSSLWYGNVMDVYDVKTPDDYTVVVLMSVKSMWALHWLGELPMIPKHIWQTITGAAIETAMPDPYLIGTGPFKYGGGEAGSEPGTGVVPQQYVTMPAYKPTSNGFFASCSILALGGIDTQGNYALPNKLIMKRTVYGPKDINGVLRHPSLNDIVPRIECTNLNAPPGAWTGTWTLNSNSITITVNNQGPPVTMTFASVSISGAANGPLGYLFQATHTPDPVGSTCGWSQGGLVKTIVADIDGNGVLNLWDILELNTGFTLWYNCGTYYANADITGDGIVGVLDAIEEDYYN